MSALRCGAGTTLLCYITVLLLLLLRLLSLTFLFPFGSSNVLDPPVISSCERPRGVNAMKMCAFSCGLEGFFLSFFLYLILSIFFFFLFFIFSNKKEMSLSHCPLSI
uniref:Uncharacterized protein n=1 Tax=Trypanosoma congolense (strain IL3000) TaxID=1068625 RepID=G0UR77_TRYCI|nr:hypothetical protein, unlikely [Trypanosoma congolense IL3000]